jgi:HTH-type transcriptional regulator / antitoxin HigA
MSRWLWALLGGVVLVAIEANRFRMEQQGLRAGTSGRSSAGARVAEVLNRKRDPLSIGMIRRLHDQLGISADLLIRPVRKSAA